MDVPATGCGAAFWSLNIGLAWMVFATLLPLGVLQPVTFCVGSVVGVPSTVAGMEDAVPDEAEKVDEELVDLDVTPLDVTPEEFDELVAAALDGIPDELASLVRNVVLLVEDDPPGDDPYLLGYYEGWALTERTANHAGALPDRILLFRNPLVAMCADREELVKEIRITVVHEIAHHFGIDDARLHQLGYG